MGPRLVRRRRDGLVEIRRARARDLVVTPDAGILLALLAGWFCFTVVLVMTLVFDPPFLGVAAWLILAFAVEHRRARRLRLAAMRAAPTPPSAA